MRDSVIVPVYDLEVAESNLAVLIADGGAAFCTRVQSMPHKFIGRPLGACPPEAWDKVQAGVRSFLSIEPRRTKTAPVTPKASRSDWWPRQNDIHFASDKSIGPDDKLYAIIADDDWNALPETRYTAAVRLTSRTKPQRGRWEIPVAGSWVVTGDLYSISYPRFERAAPRGAYPKQVSLRESAQIAGRQRTTLSLK